jgi:hypothetical protein
MTVNPESLRLLTVISLTLLLGAAVPARALASSPAGEGGPFGLGVILGDPTGFTGKYMMSADRGVDFGLAFSFGDYTLLYADYLFHFPGAFGHSSTFASELTPYVGVGGLIAFSTDDRYSRNRHEFFSDSHSSVGAGVRIPFGIEWRGPQVPIGVFVELAPGISIAPQTSGFLEGGVGARFYF